MVLPPLLAVSIGKYGQEDVGFPYLRVPVLQSVEGGGRHTDRYAAEAAGEFGFPVSSHQLRVQKSGETASWSWDYIDSSIFVSQ